MRRHVGVWVLAFFALSCSGKSERSSSDRRPGTGGSEASGGSGAAAGSGTSGAGAGGSAGAPTAACTAQGTSCASTEICVANVFDEPRLVTAGPTPANLALGDSNGDGHLDLTVVQGEAHGVVTLLGVGDGTFGASSTSATAHAGSDLALVDVDGDARLDVVVPTSPLAVVHGDGRGGFAGTTLFDADATAVDTGDIDGDGALDIVTLNFFEGSVQVHHGDDSGAFVTMPPLVVTEDGQPHDLALADLDADSVLDLAVISLGSNSLSVLRGNGDGSFSEPTTFDTRGGDPWTVLFDDWNGDGRPDAATANDFSGNVSVLLGAADGAFSSAQTYPTAFGTGSLAAADFDGDGRRDLVAAHPNELADASFLSLFRGAGDGTFLDPRTFRVGDFSLAPSSLLFGLATGDLNEDGRTDLVVANASEREVAILLGTPFGRCEPAQ